MTFDFRKTALSGSGYFNPPSTINPSSKFNMSQDTSLGIIRDGQGVDRSQMLRFSEVFDPTLTPYHQTKQYKRFYPGALEFKRSAESKKAYPTAHVDPAFLVLGSTEKNMRDNVYSDGYPRNGFVADVSLEKTQNAEFRNSINALLQGFQSLPASIAAIMPAGGVASPPAPSPPAPSPPAPSPPPLAPAKASGVPVPPPPPPAPKVGDSRPVSRKSVGVIAGAEESKMFEEIAGNSKAFQDLEKRALDTLQAFDFGLKKLAAAKEQVNPEARKFMNKLKKIDFTEIQSFFAGGGNDINQLSPETREGLIAFFNYQLVKNREKGKNPIPFELIRAKPSSVDDDIREGLLKKFAKMKRYDDSSVSPKGSSNSSSAFTSPTASATASTMSSGLQALMDSPLYAENERPSSGVKYGYDDKKYGKLDVIMSKINDPDKINTLSESEAKEALSRLYMDYQTPNDYRTNGKKMFRRIELMLMYKSIGKELTQNAIDSIAEADADELKFRMKNLKGTR